MDPLDIVIRSEKDMAEAVERLGILPLFANSLPRFSIEEMADPDCWFSGGEGPWEWKGPVIRETGCAYGKFFEGKAAFISRDWFLDFANYRRDGYDFDARCDEGLVPFREKELYALLAARAPVLSRHLKQAGGYGKSGKKGFDGLITKLQAQGYAVVSDFVYLTTKAGDTYGWGVAEYSTPEQVFGEAFTAHVYDREPEKSAERLLARLEALVPHADERALRRFLK